MESSYGYEPNRLEWCVNRLALRLAAPYYRTVARRLSLTESVRVVDWCCGSGELSAAIRRLHPRIDLACADVSARWLATAERRFGKSVHMVRIHRLDAALSGAPYDRLVCHYALHDVPEARHPAVLRGFWNSLGQGGRVTLLEPVAAGHGLDPDRLQQLLAQAGFSVLSRQAGKAPLFGAYVELEARKGVD